MKYIRLIPAIIFAALGITAAAQTSNRSIDHPMTRAVINTYTKILSENPNDYETLFRRANEYYTHNEYILALQDINKCLQITPPSQTDMRFQELSLRGNIYLQSNKPEEALVDLGQALALVPDSYSTLYQKANAEYMLGKYADAKMDYQRMLRLNQRSAEAYIGLARVAVHENNLGMANDYLETAVSFDPNNPELYVRRASVRKLMDNHSGAVDDLVLAMSIDATNRRVIESLIDYADTNYSSVIAGLSSAISQAPKNALYPYLRAQVAQAHNHYASAIKDYQRIIDERLYNYQGIYASIAECQYYMGQYEKALDNVDYALKTLKNNAEYYILRSRILRALGRQDDAIAAAAQASMVNNNVSEGLVQMALCYIDKGEYKQAAELLGEANLINAEDPYIYLIRAELLDKHLNQPVAANQFRQQVLEMNNFAEDNVKSLRGFAMLRMDNVTGAMAWIDNILDTKNDIDGLTNYYAACIYATIGDNDRAIQCAEQSMKLGYANYYNWMLNADEPICIGDLRYDLRFMNLMSRYSSLYE